MIVEFPGSSKPFTVNELPLELILFDEFQFETPALAKGASIINKTRVKASLLLALSIVLCI
jgi:hypothetical protein